MEDLSCLAEGCVVPADFQKTGLNLNEVIVGTTGSGKTKSNAESRLLHTYNSSVVVPLSKKALREGYTEMFLSRGYDTLHIDFTNPADCECGYDPMDYIHNDMDVISTARNLIGMEQSKTITGSVDPYWNDSATSVLAAEIGLVRLNALHAGKKPCFADVVKLHKAIEQDKDSNRFKSSVDCLFEAAEERYPGNQATQLWNTISGLGDKTASCIYSIVNSAIDKIFSEDVIALTRKEKRIDFAKLGEKKTALFITTSPMNRTLLNYINLMYADMFKELFEQAESNKEGCLKVPVHIICDDFACSGKITDFENYISIFRAAKISVTLLLQSESQLISMYGRDSATTIINNCDTYVYLGGMDLVTCEHIAKRVNKPTHKILSLPKETVIVCRRGDEPVIAKRYQTLADPEYKKVMEILATINTTAKEKENENYGR